MDLKVITIKLLLVVLVDSVYVISNGNTFDNKDENVIEMISDNDGNDLESEPEKALDGVYTECIIYLNFPCLQRKTLRYLNDLNSLKEVSIVGDYVRFVKLNASQYEDSLADTDSAEDDTVELSNRIDKAVDNFISNYELKLHIFGKDIALPSKTVDEFVGRKKNKGGGGGGGGGHDDPWDKKKMMTMAMMCMKMKMMMMAPAMMGMMGMMTFKGMMFSMMSYMAAKMLLLMKIMEKKASWSNDAQGWASGGGGGGGGAWMPAGGQDYGGGGGGGGGGYDSNGQWQSRSIIEKSIDNIDYDREYNQNIKPIITYAKPTIRYQSKLARKPLITAITSNDDRDKTNEYSNIKSRKKRGIMDIIQNAYMFWVNKALGMTFSNNKIHSQNQKVKIINGIKYIYQPKPMPKHKFSKALQLDQTKSFENSEMKPINVVGEDTVESDATRISKRSLENLESVFEFDEEENAHKKPTKRSKIKAMKDSVIEVMEEDPWK